MAGLTDNHNHQLGYSWSHHQRVPTHRTPPRAHKTTETQGKDISTRHNTGSTRVYVVRFAEHDDESSTMDPRDQLTNPGSEGLQLIQAGMLKRLGPREKELEQVEYGYQWKLGVSTVTDSSCIAARENLDFSKA